MAEQKNQNEHLNVEDALTQSEAFLVKYKNAIIGGVVAVIIIVAGFIMYKNLYAEPREEKAQAALFKGQEYFEQDAYEQALNGDSIGYVGFLKVADEYSGTKAANLAKAYAGICYAQLGKYDEAVKMLDGFNGNDQMVAPAILGATGNCYAQLGQLDKAASTLISAADKAERGTQHGAYGRMGDAERGERAAAPIGGNVPACCAGKDPAGDPVLHTGGAAGMVDTVQPVHCPALRQYGEQPDVGRRYVYAGYLHRRRERAGAQDVLICLGGRTQRYFHRLEPFGRKQEPEQRERAA